ncbi:MAG: hypothetical protein WC374_08400 [Phycisphaerae bacterium]
MPVTEDQRRDILKMIEKCGCTKCEKCIDTDFENLAPVKHIPASGLLECYTDRAKGYKFALPFGETHFCRCPVRAYLYNEPGP